MVVVVVVVVATVVVTAVVVVVVVVIGKDLLCSYDFRVKFVAYKRRHWLSRRFLCFFIVHNISYSILILCVNDHHI